MKCQQAETKKHDVFKRVEGSIHYNDSEYVVHTSSPMKNDRYWDSSSSSENEKDAARKQNAGDMNA